MEIYRTIEQALDDAGYTEDAIAFKETVGEEIICLLDTDIGYIFVRVCSLSVTHLGTEGPETWWFYPRTLDRDDVVEYMTKRVIK